MRRRPFKCWGFVRREGIGLGAARAFVDERDSARLVPLPSLGNSRRPQRAPAARPPRLSRRAAVLFNKRIAGAISVTARARAAPGPDRRVRVGGVFSPFPARAPGVPQRRPLFTEKQPAGAAPPPPPQESAALAKQGPAGSARQRPGVGGCSRVGGATQEGQRVERAGTASGGGGWPRMATTPQPPSRARLPAERALVSLSSSSPLSI